MNAMICDLLEREEKIYSHEETRQIDPLRLPSHVAIIMDGNRRWAKKYHLPFMVGHWKGADNLTRMTKAAIELGVKVLTVYAFSTESWNRSQGEVQYLMHLLETFLIRKRNFMVREGIRLETIGDIGRLPDEVQLVLNETKEATKEGDKIDLVIAINYGARDEMKRAIQTMTQDCLEGKLSKEEITEEIISDYLDTGKWQDPDLLIRTSGEIRLSNFLLWQLSYSEVYITNVLWPEFSERDFFNSILEYQQRQRRFGS